MSKSYSLWDGMHAERIKQSFAYHSFLAESELSDVCLYTFIHSSQSSDYSRTIALIIQGFGFDPFTTILYNMSVPAFEHERVISDLAGSQEQSESPQISSPPGQSKRPSANHLFCSS